MHHLQIISLIERSYSYIKNEQMANRSGALLATIPTTKF